jgi:ElaB/YqjD/DUF883 family membrane-anchored ribosome-binding protein
MSQNINQGGSQGSSRPTGGAGTGATDAGTTRTAETSSQGLTTGASPGQPGTGTAAARAQEYGQKIAEAANTAKDYVSDKVSVVSDKIKDLQNVDINEMANQAKDYARQKPGQAILISAAAGFVIGLLLRGSRR